MYRDLTRGSISRSLILFALPMMAGNMLQQFYNIADTLIVSRALGANALAAVGSAYTLMTLDRYPAYGYSIHIPWAEHGFGRAFFNIPRAERFFFAEIRHIACVHSPPFNNRAY